jgi:replicative DNA helicase
MTTQLLSGRDVLFYSLEMPKEEVLVRIHVLMGAKLGFDVDHVAMRDRIYDRIQYRKIVNAIKDSVSGQLFIEDSGKVTSARIAGDCARADLTVVDYLGLMHTNTGQAAIGDWRNMATISNQLKEVCINKQARIVCAAQINREGDTSSKLPPKSKTLAQSDAIGQDSDVVITMKRYAEDALAYLLDKNRHGKSGVYYFSAYEPNVGNFVEISREAADDRRYESDYTE